MIESKRYRNSVGTRAWSALRIGYRGLSYTRYSVSSRVQLDLNAVIGPLERSYAPTIDMLQLLPSRNVDRTDYYTMRKKYENMQQIRSSLHTINISQYSFRGGDESCLLQIAEAEILGSGYHANDVSYDTSFEL